jgi:hypothetical protein
MATIEAATARKSALLGQIQYWFAVIFVVGWTGVICGGLAVQFGAWEYPCPLCIVHGDPGYGDPMLGLHQYVWAWILFVAAIATIGVVLSFSHQTAAMTIPAKPQRTIGRIALWFLGIVLAVNLVAVFLLEGFHWLLPDNPNRYQFFYDLHILD